MNFNFEGRDLGSLFLIDEMRMRVLTDRVISMIDHVSNDPSQFMCDCEKCKSSKSPVIVHPGKILRHLIDGIEAENEKFYFVYCLEAMCDRIEKNIAHEKARDVLKPILEKFLK